MIGRLIDRWEYTWADVWEPLSNVENAPFELYSELYRTAADKFRRKPSFNHLATIVSDPIIAADAFRNIKSSNFKGEQEAVQFIENTYDTLDEFGVPDLVSSYINLIQSFLNRYNLRYRLVQPCSLRVQMPWLYADIYAELVNLNQTDAHLNGLMEDFEDAFDIFSRTRRRRDLRTSIAKASNYAEGVAAFALGSSGLTLGRMCDQLTIWPHDKVKESVKNLYHFCSDYPNIRHAGNPNNKLRDLDAKDTILVSALLMAFSGYMHNQININKLLG